MLKAEATGQNTGHRYEIVVLVITLRYSLNYWHSFRTFLTKIETVEWFTDLSWLHMRCKPMSTVNYTSASRYVVSGTVCSSVIHRSRRWQRWLSMWIWGCTLSALRRCTMLSKQPKYNLVGKPILSSHMPTCKVQILQCSAKFSHITIASDARASSHCCLSYLNLAVPA